MEVHEWIVAGVACAQPPPDTGWFAARQPGIVKYLEMRCASDELLGVALDAAALIHAAFEKTLGVPPGRILSTRLELLERSIVSECDGPVTPSFVARQPALAEFVASVVHGPPVPLDDVEQSRLGVVLATIVQALDEATIK